MFVNAMCPVSVLCGMFIKKGEDALLIIGASHACMECVLFYSVCTYVISGALSCLNHDLKSINSY